MAKDNGKDKKKNEVLVPQRMGKPVGKEVFDVDPKRVDFVLTRLGILAKQYQEIQLEMAPLITEVAGGEFFRTVKDPETGKPYDRFDVYCRKELKLGETKTRNLLAIQKNLLGSGIEKARLDSIGWWKSGLIAMLPPEERKEKKVDAWIKKAEKMDTPEFRAEVNKAKNHHLGKKRHNEEVTERLIFGLYPPQLTNVQQALKLAGQISGSTINSHNLDLICTSFQADRLEESDAKLEHVLKAVERTFKVKCIAIKNDKSETVEFGARTAKQYGVT